MRGLSPKARSALLILFIVAAGAFGFFAPAREAVWFAPLKAAAFVLVAAAAIGLLLTGSSGLSSISGNRPAQAGEEEAAVPDAPASKSWDGFGRAVNLFYVKFLGLVRTSMAASLMRARNTSLSAWDTRSIFVTTARSASVR